MTFARVGALALLILCFAARLDAATATWDRNPESNIAGYILSYGTQSGQHTVSIDVGNVVTYQFTPPPGQRYYVVVQAYNTSGVVGPKSNQFVFDATATPTNRAPALSQPPNQSTVRDTFASLQLAGSDPDGQTLRYSASGLPAGLSVNTTSGVISGTATTAGTYSVTATVSDGSLTASRTFTWTVSANGGGSVTVTLPPVDTTLKIDSINYSTESRLYTYTYPANRIANAILMRFDLSQIPANATIQSATLQLWMIDMDATTSDPTYSVSLHQVINRNPDVSRATGRTFDGVSSWTANTCCQNNIPLAQADISPARSTLAVDRTYGTKTWNALSVVQAWLSSPSTNYGLLLNSDATKGAGRYRTFASVNSTSANQRPFLRVTYSTGGGTPGGGSGDTTPPTVSITSPANNATIGGSSVAISASASDASGVAGVQFRVNGVNVGAEDTTAPYSVVWNTASLANGSHVITAVARDTVGNTRTSSSVTVTVGNNRPPTLAQPPNQTSAEGSPVSVALSGADPDGNTLAYSATGLPPGVSVNAATGLISGTPTYSSARTYTVTATVSDGALTQSRTFSWTVTNSNQPPTLQAPPNQSHRSGTAVTLQLVGSDPDGTAVSYQATGLPPGLTLNASTGLISGTLTTSAAGEHEVTVRASDGQLSASRTFTWSVDNTDQPVSGDFDGDGRSDPASYRPGSGEWRRWHSAANYAAQTPVVWGNQGDIPVAADYDGDRKTDIGVYRPSTGRWHILLSSTNMQSQLELRWGNAADRPIAFDYDNDGRADLALPRLGGFEILLSRSNYTTSVTIR